MGAADGDPVPPALRRPADAGPADHQTGGPAVGSGLRSFLAPLLRSDVSSLALTNTRHHRIVARTLLTAFDSKSRRKGLLGRDSMPEGSALVIAPSQAIHTFSMRFAIDVAFVSKDGVVLKVRQAVPPRRIAVSWRAFAVIELPAGALEATDTKPGDRLHVEDR